MKTTVLAFGLSALALTSTAFANEANAIPTTGFEYQCVFENGDRCLVRGLSCADVFLSNQQECVDGEDPIQIVCVEGEGETQDLLQTFQLEDDDAAISTEEDRLSAFAIDDEDSDKVAALTIYDWEGDEGTFDATLLYSSFDPEATRLEGECEVEEIENNETLN